MSARITSSLLDRAPAEKYKRRETAKIAVR